MTKFGTKLGLLKPSFFSEHKFLIFLGVFIIIIAREDVLLFMANTVKIVGIDPTAFFLFFHKHISDFLVTFAVAFYLDVREGTRKVKLKGEDLTRFFDFYERQICEKNHPQIVSDILTRIYNDDKAAELGKSLFSKKSVYRNTRVNLRFLSDGIANECFLYTQSMDFCLDKNTVTIAVTSDASLQDKLFNSSEIEEVYCNSTEKRITKEYADKFIKEAKFFEVVKDDIGQLRELKANAKIIVGKRKASILRNIGIDHFENVQFIEVSAKKRNVEHRFVFKYPPTKFSCKIPFTYWISDRNMYLDYIDVDGGSFCVDNNFSLSLLTFISGYSPPGDIGNILPSEMPVRLTVESWIGYGQGVVISWKPAQ